MLRERSASPSRTTVIPEEYEILDSHALAERLGFKRDTVLSYITRRSFHRIPPPDRHLATGPLWYEATVRDFERANRKRYGKPQPQGGSGRTKGPRA
jgi:hypothetical protein